MFVGRRETDRDRGDRLLERHHLLAHLHQLRPERVDAREHASFRANREGRLDLLDPVRDALEHGLVAVADRATKQREEELGAEFANVSCAGLDPVADAVEAIARPLLDRHHHAVVEHEVDDLAGARVVQEDHGREAMGAEVLDHRACRAIAEKVRRHRMEGHEPLEFLCDLVGVQSLDVEPHAARVVGEEGGRIGERRDGPAIDALRVVGNQLDARRRCR